MKKSSYFLTLVAVVSLNVIPAQAANKNLEINLKSSPNYQPNKVEKLNNSSAYRFCRRFTYDRIICL